MFDIFQTPLSGLLTLHPRVFADERGIFIKTYHDAAFHELGLRFETKEEFFSTSRRGVLRGMHFQVPPADHDKLIYCTAGAVLDVVLDIRRDSPTFGQHYAEELSDANRKLIYVPRGFAHGFLALTDGALMVYKTTSIYAPACDQGIRWDSFGFAWPLAGAAPIISRRDTEFPPLNEFNTPF
jgi:dTDP-4-dehydrorhamnose 3,5-epimerase